eukprot:UN00658
MGNAVSATDAVTGFSKKYKLGDRIAIGTFATVRRCRRISDEKEFAVKIVKKSFCTRNELLLLRDEVQIYHSLNHPNIIALHDIFQNSDTVKIVLELCDEQNLSDLMYLSPNCRLTEMQCTYIAFVIGNTLKYLHSQQIVHRDIKPENILFTKKGVIKLTDFGSAFTKMNRSDYDVFALSTVIGTPSYCAPEILQGRVYSYGVDLWSLGVVLFECIAGYHPFITRKTRKSVAHLYGAIIAGKYRLESVWDDIGNDACCLVQKLIEVDPTQRLTIDGLLKHPFLHSVAQNNPFKRKGTIIKSSLSENQSRSQTAKLTLKNPTFSLKSKKVSLPQKRVVSKDIHWMISQ